MLTPSTRTSRHNFSCPVAGTAGNSLPRLLIDLICVLLDRKDLAARRAAKRDRSSADPEFNFFFAGLAFHKKTSLLKNYLTTDGHGRLTYRR